MAQMKQCPQCGKYVSADRTYCMNCGITLGVRCPECREVMPVGAKTCTACGHSFVKKKKLFRFPLWDWMKKNAKPLVLGLTLLLLLLTLVLTAFPGLHLTVTLDGEPFIEHTATGYSLMGYFLGGHSADISVFLEMNEFKSDTAVLKTLFFLAGFGRLAQLCGLLFSVLLLAFNIKRFGKATARRLYAPLGVTLGGAALAFGLSPVLSSILVQGMARYSEQADQGYAVLSSTPMPLVLLIAAVLVMAVHALLHGAVLSKEAYEDERSIPQLLSVPLGALGRLLHRVIRKLRKKAGKKVSDRDEPAFTVTPRFSSYVILFVVALVFTQALLSKVSNIFFWFIFLLPLVLLVYTLIARASLSVNMLCDSVTTEKNTPYTYEFRIENHSILALPFIEAQVSIPQSNAVRCTERTVRISMAPLSGYHMKNTVSFRFRGTYDIGVKCFYVYDFFRIYRARVDVENLTTVYVLPRRLTLEDTAAHSISDDTARTVRSPLVVDKLEVSDIRDYRNGDSLKSIHWKLSSKSETFIVKDYNTGTSNQTVVFCDLTPHFPDEPPKKKEELAAEAAAEGKKKLTRKEKKAAKKAKKEEAKLAADRKRKNKRIKESAETRALSDEALQTRLDQRNAIAESLDARAENLNDKVSDAINAAAEAAVIEVSFSQRA